MEALKPYIFIYKMKRERERQWYFLLPGRTCGFQKKWQTFLVLILSSITRAPAELKNPSPSCCHSLGTAGISVSKRKKSRKLKAQQLRTRRFGSSRLEQMEEWLLTLEVIVFLKNPGISNNPGRGGVIKSTCDWVGFEKLSRITSFLSHKSLVRG